MGNSVPFPVVTHELIAGLYKKFQTILSVVEKPKPHRQATREVIKKVSDVKRPGYPVTRVSLFTRTDPSIFFNTLPYFPRSSKSGNIIKA